MNTLKTLIETNPLLSALSGYADPALPLALMLAFAGLAVAVGVLQVRGARTRRATWNKGARQLASLSLLLGWPVLVASMAYIQIWSVAPCLELSVFAFAFAVFIASLHFSAWKVLEGHRIGHAAIAFMTGLFGVAAVLAVLASLRLIAAVELPDAAELGLADIFDVASFPSATASAALMALSLAAAVPASAAPVWLLLRRRRDDFGRDHYNAMFGLCARWGFCAWLVAAILFAADALISGGLPAGDALSAAGAAALAARVLPPALVCAAHGLIAREKLPARMSPLMVAALLLSLPPVYFLFEAATRFQF